MTSRQAARGGALISALIVVLVVTTMAMGLSSVTTTSNGQIMDVEDRMHALLLAESGLAVGFKKIGSNPFTFQAHPDWDPNSGDLVTRTPYYYQKNSDQREIIVVKDTNDATGKPMLVSTGTVEKKLILGSILRCSRTIEATVSWTEVDPTTIPGAVGLTTMTIGGDFKSDSYDASEGPYNVGGNKGQSGDVGTNGVLTPNGSSFKIEGNASPGPGQPALDVTTGPTGQVTGSVQPLNQTIVVNVAPYAVPPGCSTLPNGTNQNWGTPGNTTNYYATSVDIKPNEDVIIRGLVNLYVDGSIDIKTTFFRMADDASKLVIYQKEGDITLNGGGQINSGATTTIPQQTITYPAGTTTEQEIVRMVQKAQGVNSPPTISSSDTVVTQYSSNGKSVVGWQITTPVNATLTTAVTYTVPEHTVPIEGGKPSNFKIISNTTGEVKINGGSTFYGLVLAPYADVKVNGNAEKFGKIVGSVMDLSGTGFFHDDESADLTELVPAPMLGSYREVATPAAIDAVLQGN